jgi:hypothetical protein
MPGSTAWRRTGTEPSAMPRLKPETCKISLSTARSHKTRKYTARGKMTSFLVLQPVVHTLSTRHCMRSATNRICCTSVRAPRLTKGLRTLSGTKPCSKPCPTRWYHSLHGHASNRLVTARSATDKSALGLSVGSAGSLIQATLHSSPSDRRGPQDAAPFVSTDNKTNEHHSPLSQKSSAFCATRCTAGVPRSILRSMVGTRGFPQSFFWSQSSQEELQTYGLYRTVQPSRHRLQFSWTWCRAARQKIYHTTGRNFSMTMQTSGASYVFILPVYTALHPKVHDCWQWQPQTSICHPHSCFNEPTLRTLQLV